MSSTEIGLAVSVFLAFSTNIAVASRWGAKLSSQVASTVELAGRNQTRIQIHEERGQHGPHSYVTEQLCDTIHAGQQKLTEERFDQINKRLDRIDTNILALTTSQGQMMQNMMELTKQATEELKKATAARS
jgi:Mg2+ and Co2+ transporter CorA